MRYYSNKSVQALLTADVSSGATGFALDTVTGLPTTFPFTLVIDPDTISVEVVSVTAIVGTTATVSRGQDGTTATSHSTGAVVIHAHSARDFQESRSHEAATASIHGVTGSVVGTSDSQTLTNKNLSAGSNVFPTSLVTLTGTQTLTGKTLTSPVITAGTSTSHAMTTPTLTSPTVTGLTLDGVNVSAAWSSYTPTWAAKGNGTIDGHYLQVGKTVHFSIVMVCGSTTDFTTGWVVTLPVAPRDIAATAFAGFQLTPNLPLIARGSSASNLLIFRPDQSSGIAATGSGNTAVSGTAVRIAGTYEAA